MKNSVARTLSEQAWENLENFICGFKEGIILPDTSVLSKVEIATFKHLENSWSIVILWL